jgi:hypothetical protein
MQKLAEKLNRSQRLGRGLSLLSGYLANFRGVPVLIGIVLTLVSLLLQILSYTLSSSGLSIIANVSLHVGIIVALIGILLAEPLGKG